MVSDLSAPRGSKLKPDRKPKRPPGRPRISDPALVQPSRDSLMNAAIDLFARYGYDPVTTIAVAEAAGLTQSMVYYHFGSKLELWKAAIDRLMRERGRLFPVAKLDLSHLPPLARLTELTRLLILANARQPNLARIAMHEGMARGPRLDWLVERYVGAGFRIFDQAIEAAIAAGEVQRLPIADVTNIITSAASMPFGLGHLLNCVYGSQIHEPDWLQSFSETLITVLFQGISAPRSGDRQPRQPETRPRRR